MRYFVVEVMEARPDGSVVLVSGELCTKTDQD